MDIFAKGGGDDGFSADPESLIGTAGLQQKIDILPRNLAEGLLQLHPIETQPNRRILREERSLVDRDGGGQVLLPADRLQTGRSVALEQGGVGLDPLLLKPNAVGIGLDDAGRTGVVFQDLANVGDGPAKVLRLPVAVTVRPEKLAELRL